MIQKNPRKERIEASMFGGFFFKAKAKHPPQKDDQPDPLMRAMHGRGQFPDMHGSMSQWLMWSMDESSVSQCFWNLCLLGPDKLWGDCIALFGGRLGSLFDGDGSMVFERFAKRSCEKAIQGDEKPLRRFAGLAALPGWSDWILGPSGRAFRADGYAASIGWLPPAAQVHLAALEGGWSGAPDLLGPIGLQSMRAWLTRMEAAEAKFEQGKLVRIFASLIECGALCEPTGGCEAEKELAKLLAPKLGQECRDMIWANALRDGQHAFKAAQAFLGETGPFKKEMVAKLCASKDGADQEQQIEDGAALLLASDLGWLPPKMMAKAISTCKGKGLAFQLALLEQRALQEGPQATQAKPKPRI